MRFSDVGLCLLRLLHVLSFSACYFYYLEKDRRFGLQEEQEVEVEVDRTGFISWLCSRLVYPIAQLFCEFAKANAHGKLAIYETLASMYSTLILIIPFI